MAKSKTVKSRVSSKNKKQGFKFRWWMGLVLVGIIAAVGIVVVYTSQAATTEKAKFMTIERTFIDSSKGHCIQFQQKAESYYDTYCRLTTETWDNNYNFSPSGYWIPKWQGNRSGQCIYIVKDSNAKTKSYVRNIFEAQGTKLVGFTDRC